MEIESKDVIRLMLQFMKENNLSESMKALQYETGVSLNTVDSIENLMSDVNHGRWDNVLSQISQISLPKDKIVRSLM